VLHDLAGQLLLLCGSTSIVDVLINCQGMLGLSAQELILTVHVLRSPLEGDYFAPNATEISASTGANRTGIYATLREMERKGMLRIIERSGRKIIDLSPLLKMLSFYARELSVKKTGVKADNVERDNDVLSAKTTDDIEKTAINQDNIETTSRLERQKNVDLIESNDKIQSTAPTSPPLTPPLTDITMSKDITTPSVREVVKNVVTQESSQSIKTKDGIPIVSEPTWPTEELQLPVEEPKPEDKKIEESLFGLSKKEIAKLSSKGSTMNSFTRQWIDFKEKKETDYRSHDCAFLFKILYEKRYSTTYYLGNKELGIIKQMVKMFEEMGGVDAVVKMIHCFVEDFDTLPFSVGASGVCPSIPLMMTVRASLAPYALNGGRRGMSEKDRQQIEQKKQSCWDGGAGLGNEELDVKGCYDER
jgi:hypothetical protein